MNIKHNKEDILIVGMELFRLKGYHNTGTNEILKAAKISRGSFYNFFTDKEDFALQALRYYTEGAIGYMKKMLGDSKRNPLENIQFLFRDFIDGYKSVDYKWSCLLVGMAQEMGAINDRFKQATNEHFEQMIEVLHDCIVQGQEREFIRRDKSARHLAIQILSAYNGALVMMKSGMNGEVLQVFLDNLD